MTDYTELKQLAEKASPGPWWIDSHGMTMMSMPGLKVVFNHPAEGAAVRNEETGNLSHWRNDWDASYIAAANPAAILALIAENESAHKHWQNESNNVQVLLAEIALLKAENEALRKSLTDCADSLHAEMLHKFVGQLPDDMHPVTRREYDRDMTEVAGYLAAMGKGEQS